MSVSERADEAVKAFYRKEVKAILSGPEEDRFLLLHDLSSLGADGNYFMRANFLSVVFEKLIEATRQDDSRSTPGPAQCE